MSYNLVLNASNKIGSTNSIFKYNFINGGFQIKEGSEMAISSIQIPYSWFNITSALSNNKFDIIFPNTTTATYNLTIPDGFYLISDLQNYIEYFCMLNKLYLINSAGKYVYYVWIGYNTTKYSVQLICDPVPTSLEASNAGLTSPSGWLGFPAIATTPQITILSNNLTTLIGFNTGTYPNATQSTQYTKTSDFTPNGSNVNSLIVRCNIADNMVTSPPDILDSFPITSTFGSNIDYSPSFEKWIKCKSGNFTSLTIEIQDQNFNTLMARDPNVTITLLLKIKD